MATSSALSPALSDDHLPVGGFRNVRYTCSLAPYSASYQAGERPCASVEPRHAPLGGSRLGSRLLGRAHRLHVRAHAARGALPTSSHVPASSARRQCSGSGAASSQAPAGSHGGSGGLGGSGGGGGGGLGCGLSGGGLGEGGGGGRHAPHVFEHHRTA